MPHVGGRAAVRRNVVRAGEAIVLADRIMVMCPRHRQSAAFDFAKRRVLAALDRSLNRARRIEGAQTQASAGAALCW